MTILFFMLDSCGFCKKAKEMLKNEISQGKIKVVPHTDPKAKELGLTGFPAFFHEQNETLVKGCPQSAEKLLEDLNKGGSGGSSSDGKGGRGGGGGGRGAGGGGSGNAKIAFFNMDGCGFCVKMKELLKNEIASGEVVLKSSSEAGPEVKGFPHFVSLVNGKEVSGAKQSVDDLRTALGHPSKESYQQPRMQQPRMQQPRMQQPRMHNNNMMERYSYTITESQQFATARHQAALTANQAGVF